MNIGDKVKVTNIRGNYEPTISNGRAVGMSIYIGEEGIIKSISENKCFDAIVEFTDGDRLGFKESELKIIK